MRYDLVIVGGGIIGAGVARDAALRGLKVALVEKEDIASGTTSRSTRLIHGGLRYLQQYDFALVREALRERKTLLDIAPHLVRPIPFLFPRYRGRGTLLPILWAGLILYDALKIRRGMPHHRFLDKKRLREMEPSLKEEGLVGGFLFYDGQCPFPERLCLENVLDAAENGADILTHTRVVALAREGDRVTGVHVRDELTGAERTLEGELVLNCAGPWLDDLERMARPDATPLLRRTKGVHLVVPRFTENALILETQDGKRVVFAIPWGHYNLLGTTDTDFEEASDAVRAEAEDVNYLIEELNAVLERSISPHEVLFTTAGLRPLPRVEGVTASEITRRHEVRDAADHGGPEGYATVVGGKITTYRYIAQDITDFVAKKLGRKTRPCATARRPLPGGRAGGLWSRHVDNRLSDARRLGLEPDVARHLVRTYGTRASNILKLVEEKPALSKRLVSDGPWIWATVEYAVRAERALTLTDVLLRRSSIGLTGGQGRAVAAEAAAFIGALLGWDAARQEQEVRDYAVALERNWPRVDVPLVELTPSEKDEVGPAKVPGQIPATGPQAPS